MTVSPYAVADEAKLAEIIRQAEARLSAQLAAALGADLRAMTFAGLALAAAAALLGVAFGASPNDGMGKAVIFVSTGLLISAGFACWSAKPTKWEYVGNEPGQWLDDIGEGDTLHNGMAAMAEFYDEMIKANEEAIGNAALRMWISMIAALGSMVGGIAVLALSTL